MSMATATVRVEVGEGEQGRKGEGARAATRAARAARAARMRAMARGARARARARAARAARVVGQRCCWPRALSDPSPKCLCKVIGVGDKRPIVVNGVDVDADLVTEV